MGGPQYDTLNNQQTTHNNTYTKQIHLIYIIACIDITFLNDHIADTQQYSFQY